MEKEENTTRAITALTKKIGEEEKEKIEEPKPQEIKIEKKEEKPALSAEQVKKKGDLEKKINELKEKIKKSEKLPVLLQMYREDLGKKELELQRLEAQGNSPVKPVVIKEAEKLLPVMQRSRTPEMPKKEEPKRLKTPDVKKSVLREKEERNEEEEERAPQSYNELPLREGYASGEGNNCSLHAVIGQSEHLAIAIMGKAEGKKIFAAHQKNREYSLNTVRGKVCDDLLAFLKGNRLYNVNGENRSVQDLLQDPAGGSHKVQAYLTKIKTSGEQLPPEFIVAMSYHYRISIEVLRMVEQPRWGYKANAIPEVLHHVLKNPIFVRDVAHIRNYFGTLENFLRSDEHAGTKIDGLDQCIDKNPEYVESLSQLIATIQKEQKKTKGYVNAFPNSYHQEGEAPLLVLHRGGSGQNANRVFGGHYTPLLIK